MRMCVVRNKDNSISCLPVYNKRNYYYERYNVICFVNKLWNPFFVEKIKLYFSK